ncbi:hypothetical protein FCG67_14550 [Rhodococcus oryzae]|uniref:DUF3995 domain-containing protein n=1 Tax=Rhodococcus oryzae TaxID=2571143 RepID=A0ABY2RIL5_9NOCA|nr:hypothetical protein [Rhodococcus oryzae]TJZ77064.1 hypothetical protein FCG67_14550 [Rhodococcus oryzae]
METPGVGPSEAADALEAAEASRSGLARGVVIPPWTHVWLGAAVAVQIATAAVGLTWGQGSAPWWIAAGVVVYGAVAWWQLRRFRRANGVRLEGFASRVVFGAAAMATVGYLAGLVAAYAAMTHGWWWLAAPAAAAGGVAYAVSGRHWVASYRREPARLATAESVVWLVVLGVLALGGLVLLVIGH